MFSQYLSFNASDLVWGFKMKVTLKTHAADSFCSCWWGDLKPCQACAGWEQGPPLA